MSEWKKTIVADIADFNTRSVNKDFKFDVIEYIDTSSVEKGQLTNTQEILLKEAPSRAKRRIQKNDILISSVRPNLEHYYFVDKCKENTVVSTGFVVITPKKDTYPYFLYCLLTTEQYTQYLTQVANSHTSTYPSFNPEVIENSILSIPDYPEQKRIADILSCLDAKIENLRWQNETLEQIAQTLFKHWFIDFEFPNADGKPYKSSGGAMFASESGDIPEGWKAGKLEDLIIVNPRESIKTGAIVKYVDMRALSTSSMEITDYVTREFTSGSKFRNQDALLARITPCLENGKTAFVSILDDGEVAFGSTEFIVLRAKENCCPEYIYPLARSPYFRDFAVKNMTGSSGRQRIPNDVIANYKLAIPDIQTVKNYQKICRPLFLKTSSNQQQIKTLTKTRDSLLPKLMSGQLRIEV
jgi:type I restriction enzyme, S subunit